MLYPYLEDKDFLKKVDNMRIKASDIRIEELDWNEKPIRNIEALILGGNISIDGNSSVRRTCSLSVYANNRENDITNIDNIFSINKKIKLEIGLINKTEEYQEYKMLWFPLGTFVITEASLSHAESGTTISLNLKDKMCLLNGDVGGIFPASVTLDIDSEDQKVKIYDIIQECVNHWGNEQLPKILISDIDDKVKMVMRWMANNPLYLQDNEYGEVKYTTIAPSEGESQIFSAGEDIGYVYTDFTYPEELVADAGSSIVQALDKIKETLGNYEYFYDLEGNFIFQEKKNYVNTTQATEVLKKINEGAELDYQINECDGKASYTFDDTSLILSATNNPSFGDVKNDFIVWGIRKDASDREYPCRYHLVIDEKPKVMPDDTYKVSIYEDEEDGVKKLKIDDGGKPFRGSDWRVQLYLEGLAALDLGTHANYYFTELRSELPLQVNFIEKEDYITFEYNETVVKYPYNLNHWLDFLDADSDLMKLSINNIGRRSKTENSNDINCVFEPEIPDIIIIEKDTAHTEEDRNDAIAKGNKYAQVNQNIFNAIYSGGMHNSAFDKIKNMLYNNTEYSSTITLQCLPIYHLEPNTLISVFDNAANISGLYFISQISYNIGDNSTMSITANKIVENL